VTEEFNDPSDISASTIFTSKPHNIMHSQAGRHGS